MAEIYKVNIDGTNQFNLADITSNYSSFSATPILTSSDPGAVKVATLKYKTMTTGYTNIVNVPTTTVDIYATSSAASNNKVAYVTGTSLIISNVTILGQMPDFSNTSGSNIVSATKSALRLQNILDENDQVQCNSIYFHYRGSGNQNYTQTFNRGDLFISIGTANSRNIYMGQSPAAGSTVLSTDDIYIGFDTSDYF